MKLLREMRGKTISSVSVESSAESNELTPSRDDLPTMVSIRFTDDSTMTIETAIEETDHMIIPCLKVHRSLPNGASVES